MDGFIRNQARSTNPNSVMQRTKKQINKAAAASVQLPKPVGSQLRQTAQSIHKRAQRSQTLMRSAVSKPVKPAAEDVESDPSVKSRGSQPDISRLNRAKAIAKSASVKRFGVISGKSQKQTTYKAVSGEVIQNKAYSTNQSTAVAVAKPVPSLISSVSHQQLERMLDHALTNADAHKRALSKHLAGKSIWGKVKASPRWVSVGASTLVFLLLGGFFAWQNVPQVQLKVATLRSNIHAAIPGYTPSGFSFATPISQQDNSVLMNFKSNADPTKTYAITQKPSNQTSTSLAATSLPANTPVQTSQVKGNTVYIYGNKNDAVWVNNGIEFHIGGTANLNTDQLLRIAGSL